MADLRLTAERGSALPETAGFLLKQQQLDCLEKQSRVQVLCGGQHEGIASDKTRIAASCQRGFMVSVERALSPWKEGCELGEIFIRVLVIICLKWVV